MKNYLNPIAAYDDFIEVLLPQVIAWLKGRDPLDESAIQRAEKVLKQARLSRAALLRKVRSTKDR